VGTERLSKATVAERALRLGDEEGLEAVTIRRLAQELGVTPMALYWHFKNKDELLLGITDHVLAGVRADRDAADPWPVQLRAMMQALIDAMRAHRCLPELLHVVDKKEVDSFKRATNDALALLMHAGFGIEEAYWVASYLLHSSVGLCNAQPGRPAQVPAEGATEWLRQERLSLETLSTERFPMLVELAETYTHEPDLERYYRLGVDLVIAGVEAMAVGKSVGPTR
jgi:AcrR family transcriptional regulator